MSESQASFSLFNGGIGQLEKRLWESADQSMSRLVAKKKQIVHPPASIKRFRTRVEHLDTDRT